MFFEIHLLYDCCMCWCCIGSLNYSFVLMLYEYLNYLFLIYCVCLIFVLSFAHEFVVSCARAAFYRAWHFAYFFCARYNQFLALLSFGNRSCARQTWYSARHTTFTTPNYSAAARDALKSCISSFVWIERVSLIASILVIVILIVFWHDQYVCHENAQQRY